MKKKLLAASIAQLRTDVEKLKAAVSALTDDDPFASEFAPAPDEQRANDFRVLMDGLPDLPRFYGGKCRRRTVRRPVPNPPTRVEAPISVMAAPQEAFAAFVDADREKLQAENEVFKKEYLAAIRNNADALEKARALEVELQETKEALETSEITRTAALTDLAVARAESQRQILRLNGELKKWGIHNAVAAEAPQNVSGEQIVAKEPEAAGNGAQAEKTSDLWRCDKCGRQTHRRFLVNTGTHDARYHGSNGICDGKFIPVETEAAP